MEDIMTGTEIIKFITNNVSTFFSPVNVITGSLFTAVFLRKNTATQEFAKIKAGRFQEVADKLLESGKMTYTEYYKANNFLKIAKKADELYAEMEHNKETDIQHNFDWFMRFYEIVGNISDEKVQDIWAKIMAGEINNPNSYSLKTIDILKNIGKQEAELFSNVLSCCVSTGFNIFLPNYDDYLEKCGITYSQIMLLNEIGLAYNDASIVWNVSVSNQEKILFVNNRRIVTFKSKNDDTIKIQIKQFPLTEVGKELATLTNYTLSDFKFIDFAQILNCENANVDIQVHDIVNIVGDSIEYKRDNIIKMNNN